MPAAPSTPTMMHFRWPDTTLGPAACGEQYGGRTSNPGQVTCYICRRTAVFQQERDAAPVKLSGVMTEPRGVGGSTPLKLADIIAESAELRDIIKRGLNSGSNDGEHEALTDLAAQFDLAYDEDTDTYI